MDAHPQCCLGRFIFGQLINKKPPVPPYLLLIMLLVRMNELCVDPDHLEAIYSICASQLICTLSKCTVMYDGDFIAMCVQSLALITL